MLPEDAAIPLFLAAPGPLLLPTVSILISCHLPTEGGMSISKTRRISKLLFESQLKIDLIVGIGFESSVQGMINETRGILA